MTGNELKAIRQRLGLSLLAFGLAVGYSGKPLNVRLAVRRAEHRSKVSPELERRALMIGSHENSRRKAPPYS